jgi:hypothetical protein
MSLRIVHIDAEERAREKQRSRESDELALATGTKTREQLRRENSFIPAGKMSVDFARIRPTR